MKYCPNCGAPINDESAFCNNCGASVSDGVNSQAVNNDQVQGFTYDPNKQYNGNQNDQYDQNVYRQAPYTNNQYGNGYQVQDNQSGIKTAIKVFMIIACVASCTMFFIPLIWILPMTIIAFKKMDNNQPLGIAFKICTILFVNIIAGILMLVLKDDYQI